MAISEATTAVAYRELDLQEFVQNATWRELLIELVDTNQLDPWDIDIVKVVDGYLSAIKKMKVLDLRIPANIMLAASILLRMKSDTISIFSMTEEQVPEEQAKMEHIRPEVEPLIPVARMQPKRKVSLNELLEALDQAMKITEKRMVEQERTIVPMQIVIDKVDIEDKMKRVYLEIVRAMDQERLTTFGVIAKSFNGTDNVLLDVFVPVLFLAHDGKIAMMQDQFFGEIFIKIMDGEKIEGRARIRAKGAA